MSAECFHMQNGCKKTKKHVGAINCMEDSCYGNQKEGSGLTETKEILEVEVRHTEEPV